MNDSKLEELIQELSTEYPFFTNEQKSSVREKYSNSTKSIGEIKKELLERIKEYVVDLKRPEFIPLTDFVSYHIDNSSIHIHLVPKSLFPYMKDIIEKYGKEEAKTKFDEFLVAKLDESLVIVANMMNVDEGIKKISASSELVKKYQYLFEKVGFSINPFTDEQLAHIFPEKSIDEREAFRYNAFMNREDILERYNAKLINTSENNPEENKKQ